MKLPITRAVGVDLVKVLRIGSILAKPTGCRFLQRVLHPRERIHAESLSDHSRFLYVAGCWATKEAIFKTLKSNDQRSFVFNQWYRYLESGKPLIGCDKPAFDEFQLSISHDGDFLIATVLRQELVDITTNIH